MKYILFFMVLFLNYVYACNYDTDCDVGQKCINRPYFIEGVCAEVKNSYGGSYISNDDKRSNQCSSNFDCEYPTKCIKMNGSYAGMCMVQR